MFFKATNDNMFYAIFTNEKNRDLLERLIKESTDKDIKVIRLLPTRQAKNNMKHKSKTVDILAKVDNGEVNVELNSQYYVGLENRNAGYIFHRYTNKEKVSESYKDMPNFIQINLTKGPKDMPVKAMYTLYDLKNNRQFVTNLTIYEVNLTLVKEICYNETRKTSLLEILDYDKEELEKVEGDELVEKFKKEVSRLNEDEEFVEFLTQEEEDRLYINSVTEDAFDKGKIEGIEQNTLAIAKKMLQETKDLEMISRITGLSIEQLQQLC